MAEMQVAEMQVAEMQIIPFTKLIVKSKEDISIMSEWISTQMEKNEELPLLPLELWRVIVAKAILEKRKDAVIMGNYVIKNTRGGVDISPLHWYIDKFGQESLEIIQRKTFGSKAEDERRIVELFSGSLTIKTVLAIKN